MAIAVGVQVMTDPAPTWPSIGWSSMIILILGRMIGEVFVGHRARTAAVSTCPGRRAPRRGPTTLRRRSGDDMTVRPALPDPAGVANRGSVHMSRERQS
jgi:hypothetical protein